MEDQRVSKLDPIVVGEQSAQILLDLLGIVVLSQAEPARETMDMCINHKSRADPKACSEHNIGRFSRDARKRQELLHRARHLAAKSLDEQRARAADILGFRVEEAGGSDDLFELSRAGANHRLGRRHRGEQLRRDLIHALIGALRREDRCDEQLERIAVEQRAVGVAILAEESVGDGCGLTSGSSGRSSEGSGGRGSACGHVGASVVRRSRIPRPLRILGIPVRIECCRLT